MIDLVESQEKTNITPDDGKIPILQPPNDQTDKIIESNSHIELPFREKDRENFITNRNKYVLDHLPETLPVILKHYPDIAIDQQMSVTMALLRSYYVALYMNERAPVQSDVPINVTWIQAPPELQGMIDPEIIVDNRIYKGSAILTIDSKDYQKAILSKLNAYVNLNNIVAEAKDISSRQEARIRSGESKDSILDDAIERTESLAIDTEVTMVEELAHAFYYLNAAKDPEKMSKAISDLVSYNETRKKDSAAFTDQDYEEYKNQSDEKRADIWVNAFLRTMYPDKDPTDKLKKE